MTSPIIPERSDEEIDALFDALHGALHGGGGESLSADDQLISDFLGEAADAFSSVEPATANDDVREFLDTPDFTTAGYERWEAVDRAGTRREPLPWILAAASAALVIGLIAFGSLQSTSEPVATAPAVPTATVQADAVSGDAVLPALPTPQAVGATQDTTTWPWPSPPEAGQRAVWMASEAPEGAPVFSETFGFVHVADGEDGAVVSLSENGRDWASTTPAAFISESAVRAFIADDTSVAIVVEFPGTETSPHGLFVLRTTDLERWTLWPTTSKIRPPTGSPFAAPVTVIDFAINGLGFMFLADVGHSSGEPIVVNAHPAYTPGADWGPVSVEDLAAADTWFAASARGPSTLLAGNLSGLWLAPVDDADAQFAAPPIVLASDETVLALAADGSGAATSSDVGETWRSVEVPGEFSAAGSTSGAIEASAGGPAGFVVATRTSPPAGYATDLFASGIQDGVVTARCRPGFAGPSAEHQCTRTVLHAQPDGAEPIAGVEVIPAEIEMTVTEFEQDGYVLQVEFPAEWGGIGDGEIGLMPHRLTDPSGVVVHDRPNGGGILPGVVEMTLGDEAGVTFFEPGTDNALVAFDMSDFEAATALDVVRSTIEKSGFVLELTETGGWPDLALFDSDGDEIHRVVQDDVVFGARGMFSTKTDDAGTRLLLVYGAAGEELVTFDLSADPELSTAQRTVDEQVERTVWFWAGGNLWERIDVNVSEAIRSLVVTDDGLMINQQTPLVPLLR